VPLFDEAVDTGLSLPEEFQRIYGGDWCLPSPTADRPYLYVNFVTSRDGRVSFNEPDHFSGGDVSRFNAHDQWLMGLLRARADAILIGDGTLRLETRHRWTADFIFPADAAAFTALRASENRSPVPQLIVLSLTGDVPPDATVFTEAATRVIIATTSRGAARAQPLLRQYPMVEVLPLGEDSVVVRALLTLLRRRDGVSTLLCEGGPRVYGSVLAADALDDEFLTLSPIMIGNLAPGSERMRPSLVEGVAFPHTAPPVLRPLTLRRAGDMLFMRSRLAR
jgi:riboflavin biosynthesis pyrimidine reductase